MRRACSFFLLLLIPVFLAAQLQPANPTKGQSYRIRNLYDAFGYEKKGTVLDWGFSVLIQYRGMTILFDAGSNAETLEHNAKAQGVDLRKVDLAVLSHRHGDHSSGFDYLLKVNPSVKLYLPNDRALGAPVEWNLPRPPKEIAEMPREQLYFRGEETTFVYTPSGRFWRANAEFVPKNKEVAPGLFLIATTSPLLGNFSKYPPHEREPALTGLPELSLALRTEKGVVLIVGCSHSKVEEIVLETRRHVHRRVELVMGGFHLLPYSAEHITEVAAKMKDDLRVNRVAPAHCTGNLAFKIFQQVYGDNYSYGGLGAEISFGP